MSIYALRRHVANSSTIWKYQCKFKISVGVRLPSFKEHMGPGLATLFAKREKEKKANVVIVFGSFVCVYRRPRNFSNIFYWYVGKFIKKTYKNEILKNWKVFRSHSHPKETKKDNFYVIFLCITLLTPWRRTFGGLFKFAEFLIKVVCEL